MSADWPRVQLSDIASKVTVGWVGPMTHEYQPSGIPFLRSQNVRPFRIVTDDVRYVSADFHERIKKSRLTPGDVVIVRTGLPGTAAVVPEWLGEANCSDLVIVRPGSNLDARFLAYYLNAAAQHQIAAEVVGAVQQHFNVGSAKRLQILLPSLGEQQAITSVLGALDDKIDSNRALNETLEATGQALFRSWFVDFDPVVAKSEGREPPHLAAELAALFPSKLVDTDDGPVPEGWTLSPLDQVADFKNGLALQKYRPNPGDPRLPVIKIAQLREGRPGDKEWASAAIDPECVLADGDLVFSWSGTLMVRLWCGGPGALNQHLFKVTSDRFPKWFCQQWTLQHLPDFQGIAADKATTMGHIRRHHLSDAICVVPSDEILDAANDVCAPLVESFIQNELEVRTLAALRDALLPRLLSGELRVREAEELVEEAV